VCTPSGQDFQIEQTRRSGVSIRSRITSFQDSFPPTSASSINTSPPRLARPRLAYLIQLVQVVGDTAATAREEGADVSGNVPISFAMAGHVGQSSAPLPSGGTSRPDSQHCFLEQLSIFAFRERASRWRRSILLCDARSAPLHKASHRPHSTTRLPAHRWQNASGFSSRTIMASITSA